MGTDWQKDMWTEIAIGKDGIARCYTRSVRVANQWKRAGWDVKDDGPEAWRCEVPAEAIEFLPEGAPTGRHGVS